MWAFVSVNVFVLHETSLWTTLDAYEASFVSWSYLQLLSKAVYVVGLHWILLDSAVVKAYVVGPTCWKEHPILPPEFALAKSNRRCLTSLSQERCQTCSKSDMEPHNRSWLFSVTLLPTVNPSKPENRLNLIQKYLVRTSQKTHYISAIKLNRLMLFREYLCGGGGRIPPLRPCESWAATKREVSNLDNKIWSRVPRDAHLRQTALARTSSIYKRPTRPLVREGAPQKQDRNCQTVINIWSWAPDGARHQDLLRDW
jgi:hypothetical protein